MATIVLQSAGARLGSMFGAVGAAIGAAVGAFAGYMVDRAILTRGQHYEGPRLGQGRPMTAEEGSPLPRVYGTMRVGGALIWATRFEERSTTTRAGKMGPKQTTYSYFANVALALCEGRLRGCAASGRTGASSTSATTSSASTGETRSSFPTH